MVLKTILVTFCLASLVVQSRRSPRLLANNLKAATDQQGSKNKNPTVQKTDNRKLFGMMPGMNMGMGMGGMMPGMGMGGGMMPGMGMGGGMMPGMGMGGMMPGMGMGGGMMPGMSMGMGGMMPGMGMGGGMMPGMGMGMGGGMMPGMGMGMGNPYMSGMAPFGGNPYSMNSMPNPYGAGLSAMMVANHPYGQQYTNYMSFMDPLSYGAMGLGNTWNMGPYGVGSTPMTQMKTLELNRRLYANDLKELNLPGELPPYMQLAMNKLEAKNQNEYSEQLASMTGISPDENHKFNTYLGEVISQDPR